MALKTWEILNNRSIWVKSSITQWTGCHFERFSYLECEWKMSFHINNFLNIFILIRIDAFEIFLIRSKGKETHRSWLAGRGWQVLFAELILLTWHKTSHLIGSNQLFNHDDYNSSGNFFYTMFKSNVLVSKVSYRSFLTQDMVKAWNCFLPQSNKKEKKKHKIKTLELTNLHQTGQARTNPPLWFRNRKYRINIDLK